MRGKIVLIYTFLVLVALAFSAGAQTNSRIDGLVFSDYYYNLKNHDSAVEGQNAFNYRRIYFTVENNLTDKMKFRFRLEANHEDYGAKAKLNPFVKHAFLEWTDLVPAHKLYLGIAETNAFKNSEDYWGYRSIEKTIIDLNKISSSADMGITLKGDIGDNLFHHWLAFFNGAGYKSSEIDRYKKIGYALWITPVKGLMIEGYVDYENQNQDEAQSASVQSSTKDYTGSRGYYTMKAFVGYENTRLSLGAEAFLRTNQKSGIKNVTVSGTDIVDYEKADVQKFGLSVFGSLITPVQKLKLFLRCDYFDPNTQKNVYTKFSNSVLIGGLDDESTLWIAGLDYIPTPNVHFMPNVLIKSYTQGGIDSDITARITLYLKFDTGKIVTE